MTNNAAAEWLEREFDRNPTGTIPGQANFRNHMFTIETAFPYMSRAMWCPEDEPMPDDYPWRITEDEQE